MSSTRVLIVDDQVLFAESLKKVLEIDALDLEVVGIALNGQAAIDVVEKQRPDVVLMDVRMPVLDGVQATRLLHERFPDMHIVVLTTFDDDAYVYEALQYGAEGYLLKDIPPQELIASIRSICAGGVTISPAIARKLVERGYDAADPAVTEPATPRTAELLQSLSRREREVLGLIRDGLDNPDIAARLFLSEQTVRNYVSTIYAKLGVEKRSQAVSIARQYPSI
jgi:DNA-binding NarL/FixJ family response regulator